MNSKTRSLSMTDAEWLAAKQLARANFRGNVSELITSLVRRAHLRPEDFYLNPPIGEGEEGETKPRSINEVMTEVVKRQQKSEIALS